MKNNAKRWLTARARQVPPIDQPLSRREMALWPWVLIPAGVLLIVLGLAGL